MDGRPGLASLARQWEPALYQALGPLVPAFPTRGSTPCLVGTDGQRHCVPSAFLIGQWQCGMKRFAGALRAHPNLTAPTGPLASSACWSHWTEDIGGAHWLRNLGGARLDASFDPARQTLAALDCVSMFSFYPGFGGRFHKFWEKSYWPCKSACMADKQCERTYYDKDQWSTCKPRALAAHDEMVRWPVGGGTPLAANVTPPFLMAEFYGDRAKLLVVLRSPVHRIRTAFYGHVHYSKRYGKGGEGFSAYVTEQVEGWRACVRRYGATRCAIHFEQLGREQAGVFFHADQIIRGLYSIFLRDWLRAFPKRLLAIRIEDFIEHERRADVLQRAWLHLGLGRADPSQKHFRDELQAKPREYAEWDESRNGGSFPATEAALHELYAPFNEELRDMLAADGTSCQVLWEQMRRLPVAADGCLTSLVLVRNREHRAVPWRDGRKATDKSVAQHTVGRALWPSGRSAGIPKTTPPGQSA